MKLQVFAVKDRAIGAFMQPFFAPSIGAAIRAFADGVNDATTPWAKHPDDYDLWHLSSWDDQSGTFDDVADELMPTQVAMGKQLLQQPH